MNASATDVFLYTDGACLGNPGPGGWAAILKWQEQIKELSGGQIDTTNNQMELTAVIRGLAALKRPVRVHIVTDSKYVMNGVQDWMPRWKQNNWRTAAKKPVANKELWLELDALCQSHHTSWEWVKGHSGHPMNERCDELASREAANITNRDED
ncbi:MAG: ribonuclease HI [Candidatus Puniceispirillaceae bacterium]